MSKSILQDRKECWFCGSTYNLELHHCIYGSRRKQSDQYGLTVYLCHNHHTGLNESVHNSKVMSDALKVLAQSRFERLYGHEKFMQIFGKNYMP